MNILYFVFFFLFFINVCFSYNFSEKRKLFIYFSPRDKIEKKIVNIILNSSKEILLSAYTFTSKNILKAILKKHLKGINVKILLNGKNINKSIYVLKKLIFYKIPYRLNYNYKIMHNKFLLIDYNSLETGSYNYTFSANKFNAENVLYFKFFPKVAYKYRKEFFRLWNNSLSY